MKKLKIITRRFIKAEESLRLKVNEEKGKRMKVGTAQNGRLLEVHMQEFKLAFEKVVEYVRIPRNINTQKL